MTPAVRLAGETMCAFVAEQALPLWDRLDAREPGVLEFLLRRAGSLGLLGGGVPTRYGGAGLSRLAGAVLCERAAACPSFAIPHNVHAGVATLPLLWWGSDSQKAHWLPRLARGEALGAFALTEPNAGSDALALTCRARREGDGWRLNGTKAWITNAGVADVFTLFARADEGIAAFLVPRGAPGLTIGREEAKVGLRGSSTAALYLDDVRVEADALIGAPGEGHYVALSALTVGRLNIGAAAVGMARAALALTLRQVRTRRQFQDTLGSLDPVRLLIGAMTARLFAAETVVRRVAGRLDARGGDRKAARALGVECGLAKVYATEALWFVVDSAVQLHGGYGYGDNTPVARYWRDARIFRIFEGANEIHRFALGCERMSPSRQPGPGGALSELVEAVRADLIDPLPRAGTMALADVALAAYVDAAVRERCAGDPVLHCGEPEWGDVRGALALLADLAGVRTGDVPDGYVSAARRRAQAERAEEVCGG